MSNLPTEALRLVQAGNALSSQAAALSLWRGLSWTRANPTQRAAFQSRLAQAMARANALGRQATAMRRSLPPGSPPPLARSVDLAIRRAISSARAMSALGVPAGRTAASGEADPFQAPPTRPGQKLGPMAARRTLATAAGGASRVRRMTAMRRAVQQAVASAVAQGLAPFRTGSNVLAEYEAMSDDDRRKPLTRFEDKLAQLQTPAVLRIAHSINKAMYDLIARGVTSFPMTMLSVAVAVGLGEIKHLLGTEKAKAAIAATSKYLKGKLDGIIAAARSWWSESEGMGFEPELLPEAAW